MKYVINVGIHCTFVVMLDGTYSETVGVLGPDVCIVFDAIRSQYGPRNNEHNHIRDDRCRIPHGRQFSAILLIA